MYRQTALTTIMDLLMRSMSFEDQLDTAKPSEATQEKSCEPAKPSEATSEKICLEKMTQDDDEQVLLAETESTNEGCPNSKLNEEGSKEL